MVWIGLHNCPTKCIKLLFGLLEMKASLWGYNFKCLFRSETEIIRWISQANTLRIYVHVGMGKENLTCHLQKIHVKLFLYQLPLALSLSRPLSLARSLSLYPSLSLFLVTFKHVISLLLNLTVCTLARSPRWRFSHSTQSTFENVLKKYFCINIYMEILRTKFLFPCVFILTLRQRNV